MALKQLLSKLFRRNEKPIKYWDEKYGSADWMVLELWPAEVRLVFLATGTQILGKWNHKDFVAGLADTLVQENFTVDANRILAEAKEFVRSISDSPRAAP